MIRARVVWAVTRLTFREFIRTPEALFWTYGFPLVMTLSLGFAFARGTPEPLPIAVEQGVLAPAELQRLAEHPRLELHEVSAEVAGLGLRSGRYLLHLRGAREYDWDPNRAEAELAAMHLRQALAPARDGREFGTRVLDEPGSRYIDWLIAGLIGLNLLGAGLWGVGFNLVQMRVKNLLRRMIVTPMKRSEFLLAYLLSRLSLMLPDALVILLFAGLVFGVPMQGSWPAAVALILCGGAAFIGLGLLVSSRAQTVEGVSGMMNLVIMPMWILGGSFFSAERFPEAIQPLVWVLPIHHVNEGLRAVMLEGAGVLDVAGHLGYLGGFGLATLMLALRLFRWS